MKTSSSHSNIALALASETGSLSVFLIDAMNPSLDSPPLVLEQLHKFVPSALDIQKDTLQCVTVGSDGRINLVQVRLSFDKFVWLLLFVPCFTTLSLQSGAHI